MSKREKIQLIRRIANYLQREQLNAFETKDEVNFDWYSEGFEAFWCVLAETPIIITPRVKPL